MLKTDNATKQAKNITNAIPRPIVPKESIGVDETIILSR